MAIQTRYQRHLFYLGLMLLLIAFNSTALGQDEKPLENPLVKGARALQFKVISNFSLGSFEGAAFSGKWHLSDSRALRLGVDLSGSFGTNNSDSYEEREHWSHTSHYWEISEADSNYQSLDINTHYISYMTPKKGISLYLGIGPSIGFARTKSESETNDSTFNDYDGGMGTDTTWSSSSVTTENYKQWNLGLSNIIGVEWFVSNDISFIAEYGVIFSYRWYHSTSITNQSLTDPRPVTTSDYKSGYFKISPKSVNFGLSVYF